MKNSVLEIVELFLVLNKFDGLYNTDVECACLVGHLEPCGEIRSSCIAGYKHEGCQSDCGMGCDFHIMKEKP